MRNVSQVRKIYFPFLFFLVIVSEMQGQECTLGTYIEAGIANSPALTDMSNQILAKRYDSLIERATYLPQVSFNGYAMYAPVINGWGYSEVITNGQNLSGTLNVTHQFFNKRTRETNLEKYGLESDELVISRKISAAELKKAITSQYLAACAALEERKFQSDVLATLKEEGAILKAWTEKGIYRQTDYLAFMVELMGLERNVRDLDLQFRKEFWNLNLICGISDTSVCSLALPAMKDSLTDRNGRSAFFEKFVIDSLIIRNEERTVNNRYLPVVNWFADAGLVNNEPKYIYQNLGASFGLSLSIPLFDGNQRRINYDKIRIREDTRQNYQRNFRLRYNSQIRQLQAELQQLYSLADENEKQVSLIRDLVSADKLLLDSGSLQVTDYIFALKNMVGAKHASLLYQVRIRQVINEINFLRQ